MTQTSHLESVSDENRTCFGSGCTLSDNYFDFYYCFRLFGVYCAAFGVYFAAFGVYIVAFDVFLPRLSLFLPILNLMEQLS